MMDKKKAERLDALKSFVGFYNRVSDSLTPEELAQVEAVKAQIKQLEAEASRR